jgi:superoxide dismutase
MGQYTLPDLPYDYSALERAMTGEILELHHSKHHAAYVKGANDTLEQLAEARDKDLLTPAGLVGLEKTLAFNLSGHVLHSLFWNNLSPDGGDRPDGVLADAITENFGSFEAFRKQLTTATTAVGGSSAGSRWAAGCSSSRSTTITATSARARRRCWPSTPGSTPTTCSTGTSAPTTSPGSGTSSTGRMSRHATARPWPRPEPERIRRPAGVTGCGPPPAAH